MTDEVYSDFEVRAMGIKFAGGTEYATANCVGSCEETLESKVVTKKCRGVVRKTTVKGTGTGTLKISMHVPYAVYNEAFGTELDSLIDGVKAYGENSVHKAFSITQQVFDEDDVEKLKAYPNCIIQSGISRKIENGAEEVAELELEIAVMPDDYGNGMYEGLADDLSTVKSTWMTTFTPDMVQVADA